jgi:hypothetical protein
MAESGHDPANSSSVPLAFNNFLEKMRHPSASELVKSVKVSAPTSRIPHPSRLADSSPRVVHSQAFISSFDSGRVEPDSEADSRRIQEFLRATESAFRGHPMWRDATEDELEASGEGLEKYLMTKLHPLTFAAMPDDKRVDALLSKRIAALRTFIRPEHLDIPERFHVEASLQLAEGELSKVNLFKAPRDKVVCVLNTCRIINNLLNVSSGNRPPGADDFLPVLIYVVLRANPPDLESNLRYIARFRRDSRLVSEAAYFYTNLVSATHFLTKCDHAAFTGLDADVFEAHMAAEGIDVRAEAAVATEAARDDAADADAARDDPPAGARTHADRMSGEGASDATTRRRPPPPPGSPPRRDREADDARRTVARLENELADARRRLAEAASAPKREPLRWRTVEDVEAEGAASVAAEDTAGTLRLPYQFLYARSDDLQVGDVPALLGGYKSLALQYEAMSRGVAAVLASVGDETAPTVESAPGPITPSSPEEMITVVSPLNRSSADVDGLGTLARGRHAAKTTATTTNEGLEDAFAQLGGLGGDGVTGVDARDPFAGLAALKN